MDLTVPDNIVRWLPFAYAVPVSMIVWLVMNSIWFTRRYNYLIISLLMWTTLACTGLLLYLLGINFWQMAILGILGQGIIVTWSKMQYRQKKK